MGQVPGVLSGIAHSAANPYFNQLNQFAGVSPFANFAQWPNIAQASLGNTPWNNNAWTNGNLNGATVNPFGQTGLGHTGLDQQRLGNEYADPYAAARIAQTFPFVHWGYSPFGWPTV